MIKTLNSSLVALPITMTACLSSVSSMPFGKLILLATTLTFPESLSYLKIRPELSSDRKFMTIVSTFALAFTCPDLSNIRRTETERQRGRKDARHIKVYETRPWMKMPT